MAEPVLISGSLLGTRRLIAELGGDAAALAAEAGLSPRAFEAPDMFLPAGPIVDFLELAARRCRCPDFALRHARRLPLGRRDQGWTLMRSAPTVREALRDFVNVYGLYTDAGVLDMQTRRNGAWLSYRFAPVGRWGETQMVHLTLARLCLLVSEILERPWQPQAVTLRAAVDDPGPFRQLFGGGISFGAARDAVFIDPSTLAAPLRPVASASRRGVPTEADAASHGALEDEMKILLATLLRHDICSIDTLARALGQSSRTLQRRLAARGTSFRDQLDAVRADLAWRHTTRTDLDFGRIAALLGYDSQAAFSRAFRRWYDMSPRAARRDRQGSPGLIETEAGTNAGAGE